MTKKKRTSGFARYAEKKLNGQICHSHMTVTGSRSGLFVSIVGKKLMSKGYDGEYYTEADEQIEPDY